MTYGPVLEHLMRIDRVSENELEAVPGESVQSLQKKLLDLGLLTKRELLDGLAAVYGIPAVSLADLKIDPRVVGLLPPNVLSNCRVLPLQCKHDRLVLAMADPSDVVAEDTVKFVTGWDVERVAALGFELDEVLERFVNGGEQEALSAASEELQAVANGDVEADESERKRRQEEEEANSRPVVKLVQSILNDALRRRASDVHFEPIETGLRVRYRIDGALHEVTQLPGVVQPMVISRLKLTSGMDISEKRRPQDGRMRMNSEDREIDLRVSSLPVYYGESVVLRILDTANTHVELESIGMEPRDLQAFQDMIRRPQGMILLTGPTGSGKTSTLYGALMRLHKPDVKIVTVEDPVEFQISGINQVQVNKKAGLTFANSLRSILRQDPNVIMVGEIRDTETAMIAFEAAMTGHLVLSTLHTNDAPSAISRLLHLGVPYYLVASTLLGVVAQRLVSRLCVECRAEDEIRQEERDLLRRASPSCPIPDVLYVGRGCDRCEQVGSVGRMGIFEVLRVTDRIKSAVFQSASEQEIKTIARRQGMRTLLEDGLKKCEQGLASLPDLLKVAPIAIEEDDEACDEVRVAVQAAPHSPSPLSSARTRVSPQGPVIKKGSVALLPRVHDGEAPASEGRGIDPMSGLIRKSLAR